MPPREQRISPPGPQPPAQNMKRALQAIGLLIFVVLFNFGLYVATIWLVDANVIDSQSSYPAFVLFLSFSMSIGIILIVALGERVDTRHVQNEFVKKFGVTPIMVIVAAIFSVFATLSPWAQNIVPEPNLKSKFMLANVGVTCATNQRDNSPQASDLIVMIYAPEDTYIKEVQRFLDDAELMKYSKTKKFDYVKQDPSDRFFKILRNYSQSKNDRGSATLEQDMRDHSRWIAYRLPLQDAGTTTFVPIPTQYERIHRTRLFVVVDEFPETPQPEVTALFGSLQSPSALRMNLLPLFQVEISPRFPKRQSHLTDLDFELMTGHICWHGGLS